MPVIVGGTHYYIESLLWQVLIDNEKVQSLLLFSFFYLSLFIVIQIIQPQDDDHTLLVFEREKQQFKKEEKEDQLVFTDQGVSHLETGHLHELLKKVDPPMADSLHPNNRRKIIR